MKKLSIFLILIFLVPSIVSAFDNGNILLASLDIPKNQYAMQLFSSHPPSGGGPSCDDCSGSLRFAWHMEDNDSTPDVTIGTPCGCADTDEVGTQNGSPGFSASQKSDGTYSLYIDALDESYEFSEPFDFADYKITFDIYVVSYPSTTDQYHEIFRVDYSADAVGIFIKNGGTVRGFHYENSVYDEVFVTVSTGSFISCEYQGKENVAGTDHYLKCGVNEDINDDDLGIIGGDSTGLYIGDKNGDGAGAYYIDNFKITVSDYF